MNLTIEEVTEIAKKYLSHAGYSWIKVSKVNFDQDKKVWEISAEVGITYSLTKKVKIDDGTEKIIGFE